ncbi:hypothetical protein HAX54_013767 [Datura stramonium]|uniref:Uncharacterized protein n=1 Tax=Datura stramonium TaxID=4076 RepID=A0ABS8TPM0_DATST|nr:hypothetical protein [Datura stramonium]
MECARQPCPSATTEAQRLLPRAMEGMQQLPSRRVGMCYTEDLALCLARNSPLLGAMACARQPCPSTAAGAQQLLPRAMAGMQQLPSRRFGMCYMTVARRDATRLPKWEKVGFSTSTRKRKIKSQAKFIKELGKHLTTINTLYFDVIAVKL